MTASGILRYLSEVHLMVYIRMLWVDDTNLAFRGINYWDM